MRDGRARQSQEKTLTRENVLRTRFLRWNGGIFALILAFNLRHNQIVVADFASELVVLYSQQACRRALIEIGEDQGPAD